MECTVFQGTTDNAKNGRAPLPVVTEKPPKGSPSRVAKLGSLRDVNR